MAKKLTYEELEQTVQELEREVLERQRVEKALQESEERFRLLYERAPLGYQSLDMNGNFIEVNQAWLDTLEYTREEVIGKNFGDFLHPDWVDHFKENFPRFKAIGEILGVEFEMVKKNGSHILVSFNGRIGHDEKGEFKQTHCILHNITEQRQAEEALSEAHEKLYGFSQELEQKVQQKTKELEDKSKKLIEAERLATLGKIANRVAHEIRNPLTVVGGFLRRMENKLPDDDPNKNYLEVILSEFMVLERNLSEIIKIENSE